MTTARTDPTRYMAREGQFCSLCYAQGKGWIKVANTARITEIGMAAFKRERRRLAKAHLANEHGIAL